MTTTPQDVAALLRAVAVKAERLPSGAPQDDTTAQWITLQIADLIPGIEYLLSRYTAHLDTDCNAPVNRLTEHNPVLDMRLDDALTTAWKDTVPYVGNWLGCASLIASIWTYDHTTATQ